MVTSADLAWRDDAACKGVDPNVFVPNEGRGGMTGRQTYKVARTFCSRCEVVNACLNYALLVKMEFGMYGGTTPRERRVLRKVFVTVVG